MNWHTYMALSIANHMFVAAFVIACLAGIACFFWITFFLIRMGFQLSDPKDTFSIRTLWNPLNALLSPGLLSPEGMRSRRFVFIGVLGFVLSIAIALSVGGLVWIANKV